MTTDANRPEMPTPSPCVGICCMGADGLCFGCFRTRAELTAWATATESEKRDIVARSRARQPSS